MGNPVFLSVSLTLLLLFHGSLARPGHGSSQQQNQCQLNRLDAREPDNRVESEAGVIESWDHNDDQFQCTGTAVLRITIEQNGLHLPSYSNAPQLFHVVQGRGVLGVIFPGCPETFEESDDEPQQQRQQRQQGRQERQEQQGQEGRQEQERRQGRQGQQGRQEQERRQGQQGQQGRQEQERRQGQQERQRQSSQQQPDRHQKIRRIREGDIVAIPAGVVYWTYNDGDQELVAVNFHHVNNQENQLDQTPRKFYIAGNPEDEFNPNQGSRQQQQQRSQGQQERQGQQGRQGRRQGQQGQQGNGNNVLSGFDRQLLADALNVDQQVVEKLQAENDNRGNIVRVQGQLDLVTPPRSQSERQREQQVQRELQQERQQQGRGNGIEETVCSLRLQENIGDPSRADVFSPQAGRISSVNANNLPILDNLGLSAERGFLYRNAIYTPHWNNNAHAVVYVIKGRARVQVVDHNGNNVFDDEVREGQVLPVPQNFAVASQAGDEGFEWVAFKTHENARITPLVGRLSVLRALPDQVLRNAFQLSQDEVKNVKYNRRQVTLFDSPSSSSSAWNIVASS